MTVSSQLPSYQEIAQALTTVQAATSAAEAHGMLCGFICAGKQMDGKNWIEPILGSHHKVDAAFKRNRDILLDLYEVSSHKLQDLEFGFQLLLPDDDAALKDRAEALSQWCHGFLSGLGLAGINEDNLSEDCDEALRHISEIAKLDYEAIEVKEEDEKAFFEVSEYVRVVVLMFYSELSPTENQGETGQSASKKSLH